MLSVLKPNNVGLYVRYLLQLAFHFPVVLTVLCDAMQRFSLKLPKEIIPPLIKQHLEYRRSDAVCWTIYLGYLGGRRIGAPLVKRIVGSGDCMSMAALLAVGADKAPVRQFVLGLKDKHHYEIDKYWILVYELIRGGDIQDSKLQDYFNNSGLDVLQNEDVSFLRRPKLSSFHRKTATSNE
jgi:hypothetical protein